MLLYLHVCVCACGNTYICLEGRIRLHGVNSEKYEFITETHTLQNE